MEGVYRVLNGNWKQESRPACGKSQYIQYKRISFLNLFLCRKDRLIFTIFTRCVLFLIGEVLQFCVCTIKPDSTSFFLRMMILGIAVAISTNNIYSHGCNKYKVLSAPPPGGSTSSHRPAWPCGSAGHSSKRSSGSEEMK